MKSQFDLLFEEKKESEMEWSGQLLIMLKEHL